MIRPQVVNRAQNITGKATSNISPLNTYNKVMKVGKRSKTLSRFFCTF